ncbi:MAG: sulfotransferase family protein [Bryobacteraceae bacterium]|jgi:hypothetical protein
MEFIAIVSGLPRSGTSLMMQMLEAGGMPVLTDGVRAPDADNPRGYFEFEPVKSTKRDASWVGQAQGKAVKVVYPLLRALPPGYQYRVIMMRRDVTEVVRSQRAMLERSGRTGAGVSDERMVEIFEEEIGSILGWLSREVGFEVLEVNFRDCLKSATAVAASVNCFFGRILDEPRMVAAVDASLYRQRGS